MGFFEWWADLNPWARYGVSLLFLGISTGLFFFADTVWPWGWVVGGILLCFSGKSHAEKNGYDF